MKPLSFDRFRILSTDWKHADYCIFLLSAKELFEKDINGFYNNMKV